MAPSGPFDTKKRIESMATTGNNPVASQAFICNGFIFVTGQTPGPDGTFSDKVRQCCENIKDILAEAGSDLSKVAKVTVFVDNLGNIPELNAVYRTYFPHKPSRSAVEVSKLARSVPVEIECVAAL